MTTKITVCVIYVRYADGTEPLVGFVESEETAREIDRWWREQPGGMKGTWEDFEIEVESRDQTLYAIFSGTPEGDIKTPEFWDPICFGVYTTLAAAERATRPKWFWQKDYYPIRFVVPFRLGWKFDRYFPNGKPWPPDKL